MSVTQSETKQLGDVATFVRGINFKPHDVVPESTPGTVACMRTKNVQAELDQSDVWFVGKQFVARDEQFLTQGDILISSANSWNLVGKCCWIPKLPRESTFGGFVTVLRAKVDEVFPRYLFHWFSSPKIQDFVRSFGRQTTNISNLDLNRCLKLPLPLPSLSEQKRIAEILDRAEALRAKRRAALALLDELTQSIFFDMFGEPVTNPKGWKQATIAQLCGNSPDNCVGGPFGSDLTQGDYVESPGVPVVRGQNLSTDEPYISEVGFVFVSHSKARKLSRNSAIRGDVLISQRGARLAGQVALIPPDSQYENYIVSQSQMRIRPDTSMVDPLYLVYYFRSSHAVRRMESLTISTGVPHINLGILRNFAIEVPHIELQREFVRRAGDINRLKATMSEAMTRSDSLFASLQHRAFRGEL